MGGVQQRDGMVRRRRLSDGYAVTGGTRAFEVADDGPRRPPPRPLCNLCHRQILFVRDDDDWRHLDALASDDAHPAVPQVQP